MSATGEILKMVRLELPAELHKRLRVEAAQREMSMSALARPRQRRRRPGRNATRRREDRSRVRAGKPNRVPGRLIFEHFGEGRDDQSRPAGSGPKT